MNSFYGGQQGKNFKISAIFRSAEKDKTENNNPNQSLRGDLDLGWNSPIGIGELVYISYGLSGTITDTSFDVYGYNKALDHELKHAYNGTIWQKIYKEPDTGHEIPQDELTGIEILWASNANTEGFGYKLIASTTGTTPTLTVNTTELLPDGRPNVSINNTDLDFPILTFELPVMPDFQLINTVDSTGDAQDVKWLPPDGLPTVRIERDWENEDEAQRDEDLHFVFSIPKPIEVFELDQTETQIVDNPDVGQFDVSLEKNSDWQSTVPTDSGQYYSHFGYNLAFKIPRASRFFYAPLDDINNVVDFDVTNPIPISVLSVPFTQNSHEMHGGDFFIDSETGFLFECVESDSTQTLNFIARFDTPTPDVFAENGHYTYQLSEGTWSYVAPAVTKELTGNQDWTLRFIFPPLPDFSVESSFIGAEEGEGSVVGEVVPEEEGSSYSHEYQFTFTIPRGSRWFAGTGAPTLDATDGRKLGDYWLDGETGLLWKYVQKENEQQELENVWSELVDPESGNQYSIRGPVGKALNIIAYEEYTSSTAATYDDIATQLSFDYPSATDEQIVSVYWPSDTPESAAVYWFTNTTNDGWVGTKVTGSISHLLKNEYYDNGDSEDFGYTVEYINGLLKNNFAIENKDKVGYTAEFIEKLLSWNDFIQWVPVENQGYVVFSSEYPFSVSLSPLSASSGAIYFTEDTTMYYTKDFTEDLLYNKTGERINAYQMTDNTYVVGFKSSLGSDTDIGRRVMSNYGFVFYPTDPNNTNIQIYATGNLSDLYGGIIDNRSYGFGAFSTSPYLLSTPNLDISYISRSGFYRNYLSNLPNLETPGWIDFDSITANGDELQYLFGSTQLKAIPQLPCHSVINNGNICLNRFFQKSNSEQDTQASWYIKFSTTKTSECKNIYRIPEFTSFGYPPTPVNIGGIVDNDPNERVWSDAKFYTNLDVIYPPSWTKEDNETKFFVYYPLEKSFPGNTVHPAIGRVENGSFVAVSDSDNATPVLCTKGDRVYVSCGDTDNDFTPVFYTWSNNPADKTGIIDIVDESATNNIYYTWIDGTNAEISGCKVYSFVMPENKVVFVCENGDDKVIPDEWVGVLN